MKVYIPKSKTEFQNLVDIAEGALALDAARIHGLVEGGPGVNVERCSLLLEEGAKQGIFPRKDAIERFVLGTMLEQKLREKGMVLGMKFEANFRKFDHWLNLLKQFVEREGHACVPRNHKEDGGKLGAWVMNTRLEYKKQVLADWKIESLEDISGWTWSGGRKHNHFLTCFNLLKEFRERHGHINVPSSYQVGGIPLGRWLAVTRSRKNQGKLSLDKVKMLDQFPGWDVKRTRGRKAKSCSA